jgi:cellulose synthase/poly-beta-1,6-N-acetylglucosamine synthase-like glycosyltransferase
LDVTLLALLAAGSFGAIALIWFGYPALTWLAARLVGRPMRPVHNPASSRTVSVILATRDAADTVLARVANLYETGHPASRLDVIVALDAHGALSAPEELTAADPRLRVVRGDEPGGKAAALNAGVRAATGEILVMADAQQRFDARTIPELVAALEDERFGAVSGALTLGGDGASPVHWYWALEKWLRYNEARLHSSVGVTGAVYATRRALWPVIPTGALLDDVYVPMSLVLRGHRVGFSYAARAWDVRAFDAQGERVRKTRTLTGVLQLRHLLPGLMSPARNPIWAQFVAHKLLRLATPMLVSTFVVAFVGLALITLAIASTATRLSTIVLLVLPLLIPDVRKGISKATRWFMAMQRATVLGTWNGIRGRWQIW